MISEQQYCFMPGKSKCDVLHVMDLGKAHDRVQRGGVVLCDYVWLYIMYGKVCATDGFKVLVGLHQGSPLGPFLFAVMGRLMDKVRQKSPWTMMFKHDTLICSKSRG